jgi:hypothetical protein
VKWWERDRKGHWRCGASHWGDKWQTEDHRETPSWEKGHDRGGERHGGWLQVGAALGHVNVLLKSQHKGKRGYKEGMKTESRRL